MPYRKIAFVRGEIYHVFNRSVARQSVFVTDYDYLRLMEVLEFYSYEKPLMRYSYFRRLSFARKKFLGARTTGQARLVQILSFCIMPNHMHFLIREVKENGISKYMRHIQNSYARYFNTKNDRVGALFQEMFKAVRIETDEQLMHVARYIHLNPLTSYVIKNFEELGSYNWSSYPIYIGQRKTDLINYHDILNLFPNLEKFIDFNKDQVGYQQELDRIKHLL